MRTRIHLFKGGESRARRALRAVLIACLGVTFVTALPAAPALAVPPAEDAFYKPPVPLPAGKAGDIIRSRPAEHGYGDTAKAWQVMYRSQAATGEPIAVTGIVFVPTARWTGSGERPMVSYGVGTRGLGDECAPSYTLAGGLDYESSLINDAIKLGWAVVVTDMQGLGTPGMHTYEVGRAQGMAVLDAARAAQRLPATGLGATTPVGIWGYSQGGTSAGWAAELAGTYAPELKLKGVAASGVPADLIEVAKGLNGSPFVAFMFLAAVGYDAAYPELKLESYLNAEGLKLLESSQDLCLVSVNGISTMLGTSFKKISDFANTDPLATPAWQARLNENKLGSTKPTVPVFQSHAFLDEIIPFGQADTLHKNWCKQGANVTWKVYGLAEHAIGILRSRQDSLNFLSARFAGTPVKGNC